MSEKGLGRLRKGETAGNNKLEKEIICDFRQKRSIYRRNLNYKTVRMSCIPLHRTPTLVHFVGRSAYTIIVAATFGCTF